VRHTGRIFYGDGSIPQDPEAGRAYRERGIIALLYIYNKKNSPAKGRAIFLDY